MYFTRFPINLTRREARRLVSSPYHMHAAVAGSFPPLEREGDGRILWRIDKLPGGGAYLYIVSPGRPSLIGMNEQIGFPDLEPSWQTRDYGPFLEQLAVGQRYAFRLVANPTVSRSTRGGNTRVVNGLGNSKRISHLTILQQEAWLIGKDAYTGRSADVPELFASQTTPRSVRSGFVVLQDEYGVPRLVVSNSHKRTFAKGSQKNPITLSVAQFDGLLEVSDAEALRHALVSGIGHGKGFGCGLMTLAILGRE